MEKFIWSEILTILSLILCFNLFDLVNGMVPGKVVKFKKNHWDFLRFLIIYYIENLDL